MRECLCKLGHSYWLEHRLNEYLRQRSSKRSNFETQLNYLHVRKEHSMSRNKLFWSASNIDTSRGRICRCGLENSYRTKFWAIILPRKASLSPALIAHPNQSSEKRVSYQTSSGIPRQFNLTFEATALRWWIRSGSKPANKGRDEDSWSRHSTASEDQTQPNQWVQELRNKSERPSDWTAIGVSALYPDREVGLARVTTG